jgi:hypothetical protein
MARPLRIEFEDALYHLTSRGNERRNIFRSDRDRKAFLTFLGAAARRFGWSITAWVLMQLPRPLPRVYRPVQPAAERNGSFSLA